MLMPQQYKHYCNRVNNFHCLLADNLGCTLTTMTLGKRLIQARKYAGLTQVQLAEKAGVSQQSISYLEIDKYKESASVVRLAMACGVRPEWLAEEQGEMVDGMYVEDERIKHIAMVCESLPGYAVDQLVQQSDALAELIEKTKEAKTG